MEVNPSEKLAFKRDLLGRRRGPLLNPESLKQLQQVGNCETVTANAIGNQNVKSVLKKLITYTSS